MPALPKNSGCDIRTTDSRQRRLCGVARHGAGAGADHLPPQGMRHHPDANPIDTGSFRQGMLTADDWPAPERSALPTANLAKSPLHIDEIFRFENPIRANPIDIRARARSAIPFRDCGPGTSTMLGQAARR